MKTRLLAWLGKCRKNMIDKLMKITWLDCRSKRKKIDALKKEKMKKLLEKFKSKWTRRWL